MTYRMYRRRTGQNAQSEAAEPSRRASELVAAVVAVARPRREQEQDPRAAVARDRVPLVGVEA